jgi:hypothetical protein
MSKPFVIVHPERGEALCDEHQFAEFAAAGWSRKDDHEAEMKPKAPKRAKGDGKPD